MGVTSHHHIKFDSCSMKGNIYLILNPLEIIIIVKEVTDPRCVLTTIV